ncbi:MAG: Methionine synthase, vitamin-B12 independent, putative, partial [uncultured Nocardioidaceae bacterium]
ERAGHRGRVAARQRHGGGGAVRDRRAGRLRPPAGAARTRRRGRHGRPCGGPAAGAGCGPAAGGLAADRRTRHRPPTRGVHARPGPRPAGGAHAGLRGTAQGAGHRSLDAGVDDGATARRPGSRRPRSPTRAVTVARRGRDPARRGSGAPRPRRRPRRAGGRARAPGGAGRSHPDSERLPPPSVGQCGDGLCGPERARRCHPLGGGPTRRPLLRRRPAGPAARRLRIQCHLVRPVAGHSRRRVGAGVGGRRGPVARRRASGRAEGWPVGPSPGRAGAALLRCPGGGRRGGLRASGRDPDVRAGRRLAGLGPRGLAAQPQCGRRPRRV